MLGEVLNTPNAHTRTHKLGMSNEIVKRKSLRDSSEIQKRESLLERLRLAQQRKSLATANLAGKAFLVYHELAPALMAFADNKRSSIPFAAKRQIRDSLQARRFSRHISQDRTVDSRTMRMSAASKDWELKLIDGLLGDGEVQELPDLEEWRRFTVTGFSDNGSLELTLPEPEAIPLPPSPQPLEILKVSAKPCLRVVQAVEVSEEVLDEFDYASDSEISEDETSQSDLRSIPSGEISPCSSSTEILETKGEDSWPLPANGSIPAILSPTTPLPDPLRCNPPERTITKSRSHQSLRSVRSNRHNRKAFVMQQNDSSLSIHSLGTTTTKSVSDIESVLDPDNAIPNVRNKNRKFPQVFGQLKRSNASRASLGLSMLTPVAETFERARKGSAMSSQADVEADQTEGKSAQSLIAEKKTGRFVFQGALVRRGSRRTAGRL